MKGRFSTVDIAAIVKEWKRFIGMRVVNVYDIDSKTYLIRLNRPEEKAVLLLESGIRLHSTDFDWPKNPAPSGFSMKLRKHLKNRRLEGVQQLGMDRIVDLQFGSEEAAYHVILELYDRGNIVLTDFEFTILNILRPRTDQSQDVRLAVHETYPRNIKQHVKPETDRIREIINAGKNGDPLKKLLLPHLDYGPAILEHCLLSGGFSENVKLGNGFNIDQDLEKLMNCLEEGEKLLVQIFTQPTKGYITQRKDKRPNPKEGESEELLTYEEFHPYLFHQLEKKEIVEHPTFDKACDEFFSKVESQRLDMKALQQERTALKKLEHVKKDNEKRIQGLQQEQETDAMKGQLIELNLQLVDQAILIVRNAIANQIDWNEIWNLIKEAQMSHDPVAMAIKGIKLDTNHITMSLADPYLNSEDSDEDGRPTKPTKIDIDLSLSAYANSRKYFEKKKTAKKKEQKTMDASSKAFKSAEKKALKALKEVATAVSINKTRKTYWFEKFLWFISSENFLVIGGRDSQQNELIVKRYFRPGDIYVHADLHGASSVIIKNHTSSHVPPKTLNEAGTMAICNSAAWDAKVITSAWYVYHEQVSKTAPSGEYLTTGSFMIRGKKNYLPPSYLIYGFTLLFKLEEGSVDRHRGERKIKTLEEGDETASVIESEATDVDPGDAVEDEDEDAEDGSSSSDEDVSVKQEVKEEEEDGSEDEGEISPREVTEKEEEAEEVKSQLSSDDVEEKPEESSFPDTSISLQHVKGEKFELQRGISITSALSSVSDQSELHDDTVIYLGDDKPVILGEKKPASGKQKLSAKQRRDLKKGRKDQTPETTLDTNNQSQNPTPPVEKQKQTQQQPLKRGQKAKLRKIKEKYGDQDEEERQLRMGILQSDGPKKEPKRKGKKAKELQQRNQQQAKRTGSGKPQPKSVVTDILDLESLGLKDTDDPVTSGPIDSERVNMKTEDLSDEERDDDGTHTAGDLQLLESLTGLPVPEDEILYAVPMCAPYNCLTNYKYKVKILPGNTKRGKATKTALNMFVSDKTTTSREKDLIKILKDVDISRNLPGKVKLQAPNITKRKK